MKKGNQTLSRDIINFVFSDTLVFEDSNCFDFSKNISSSIFLHKQVGCDNNGVIPNVCDTVTIDSLVPKNNLLTLHSYFQLTNDFEISSFLITNMDIFNQIVDCKSQILNVFGKVDIKMTLITDVEVPDWRTLFFIIPHNNNIEEMNNKMETLIRTWYIKQSKKFKKLVTIITE